MDNNSRVEYHVYTKIKDNWFDKRFPALEYNSIDNFAISKIDAFRLAGKYGRVWLIKTTSEQLYAGKTN